MNERILNGWLKYCDKPLDGTWRYVYDRTTDEHRVMTYDGPRSQIVCVVGRQACNDGMIANTARAIVNDHNAALEIYKALDEAVHEVVIECEKSSGLMADEKYKFVNPARVALAKFRGKS